MNAQPKVTESLSDEEREQLIDAWTVILAHEWNLSLQSIAMHEQRRRISERSPQQVAKMERAKGLR